MPVSGRPWGRTPSPASAATAAGISPSPQALSITPSRRSRTSTSRPARAAYSAAARPTGPPPATTRSRTDDLRPAGPGQRGQGGVLDAQPDPEQEGVRDGEAE